MLDTAQERLERRVLFLAPTIKDATLTRAVLGDAGISCDIGGDPSWMARELRRGAAALLVTEDVVSRGIGAIAEVVAQQPPWSDVPILMLTRHGVDLYALETVTDALGNVILLERPIGVKALANAVRSALRARDRQYRARALLLERDRAARALEETDRRKDEFLATLAHELRNPLAPIRNSIHVLRLAASPDPMLFEMMERQVGYMVRLIDDLLEVSRITRGKIDLRKEQVDLAVVIQAAIETTQPLMEGAHHRLSVQLPQTSLSLEADPIRLAQVFTNLLSNSAKYTDDGGRIEIVADQEGDQAVVTVRDSGIGITPDALPRVFDMFMQGDATGTRGRGGLGIGLTLSRTLVEMHGGSVTARSEGPGTGSEFVVRLPLSTEGGMATLVSPHSGSAAALVPTRVLVVDDNRDGADSLGELLALLGADVHVVYDGLSALDAFDAHHPELVLLDIGMPGMNGLEVARSMRAKAESREVTLVALTGWGQERDRRETRDAGFDQHLIKPVPIDALQVLLNSAHEAVGASEP